MFPLRDTLRPLLDPPGGPQRPTELPWVRLAPARRYFATEDGRDFLLIGQNDALTWPEWRGLLGRRDLSAVEANLRRLARAGVTVMRMMLEYVGSDPSDRALLENPCGRFVPQTVQAWDDLFALCVRHGLRLLLTPFDTYYTWVKWEQHPYNAANGGPCAERDRLTAHPAAVAAIKRRMAFAIDRWGGSGALFAWDLWNELGHPHTPWKRQDPAALSEFVAELSAFVRGRETKRYGRAHPQTVSLFSRGESAGGFADIAFRHPSLDFSTLHVYEPIAIDRPNNTIAAALAVARWVRYALEQITDDRPFTDSETGPIHTYLNYKETLPAGFDDEYFRHMAWAHLASGAAGGMMRWPNRAPHVLTAGMRRAQRAMARFARHIRWSEFRSRNIADRVVVSAPGVLPFACGDDRQAVVWLLRGYADIHRRGRMTDRPAIRDATVEIADWPAGTYSVRFFDTETGRRMGSRVVVVPPIAESPSQSDAQQGCDSAGSPIETVGLASEPGGRLKVAGSNRNPEGVEGTAGPAFGRPPGLEAPEARQYRSNGRLVIPLPPIAKELALAIGPAAEGAPRNAEREAEISERAPRITEPEVVARQALRDPETPAEVLRDIWLAYDGDAVWDGLSAHPNTPTDVLAGMFEMMTRDRGHFAPLADRLAADPRVEAEVRRQIEQTTAGRAVAPAEPKSEPKGAAQ